MDAEERGILKEILRNVQETNNLVREIKLWRRFVAWAFGCSTVVSTIWELWRNLRGKA